MRHASAAAALTLACVITSTTVGCAKPEPPVLTPKDATVTSLDSNGATFQLRVEAFNPNAIELAARSVSGKITLDGRHDLGTVTLAQGIKLPAKERTMLTVPLTAKWSDVAVLAALATENRAIPYAIDGVETLGGDRINVDVPFHVTGAITHDDLVKAASRALPGLPQLLAPR